MIPQYMIDWAIWIRLSSSVLVILCSFFALYYNRMTKFIVVADLVLAIAFSLSLVGIVNLGIGRDVFGVYVFTPAVALWALLILLNLLNGKKNC